ncbi:hypothetical protein [Nonomuraea sp. MG754425]|uniref:hypothetical protein n=1 Tax=Nonomuraea sp. MG754425 TaxID=2570319 RepID=UPI001F1B5629|nr:hypothetical protein [Nonomuraea sp. MG754425]
MAASGWDVTAIDPLNLLAAPPGLLPEAPWPGMAALAVLWVAVSAGGARLT